MPQGATRRAKTQLHENPVSISDENEVKRKPPGVEKDFLKVLIQNVVRATTLKNRANEAFDSAMNQFPSGLPYPDGAQRIKNTSAKLSTARKMLATAHNRLNDFLNQNRAGRLRRFG